MYDIYKRAIARKQISLDSTICKLQEDIDVRHTWQVVLNWKCSSMSLDHASIKDVWQVVKMK